MLEIHLSGWGMLCEAGGFRMQEPSCGLASSVEFCSPSGATAMEMRLSSRNKETNEGSAFPKAICAPIKFAFVLAWSISPLLV